MRRAPVANSAPSDVNTAATILGYWRDGQHVSEITSLLLHREMALKMVAEQFQHDPHSFREYT